MAAIAARNARFVSCVDEARHRENEGFVSPNEIKRFASSASSH
jgi:hypothetical protein